MDDLYQETILDHYKNPRNSGIINLVPPGAELRHLHAANAGCGDSIDADVVLKDGLVIEIKWRGSGCAISQASMSLFSDWLVGKNLTEIPKLGQSGLLDLLGLNEITSARVKCLMMPLSLFTL